MPILVAPLKNSTLATLPPTAVAFAASGIVAGAVNVAPFVGDVSVTVGGALPVTVMFTAVDVPETPRASTAVAVSDSGPPLGVGQTNWYGAVVAVPIFVAPA